MPVIFSGSDGRTIPRGRAVAVQPGAPSRVRMLSVKPNLVGTRETRRIIVTDIGIDMSTNHQFLHTLGADIFIYAFGDRIGTLTFGGLAFGGSCDTGIAADHGIDQAISYYRQNRLTRRGDPIEILVGRTPLIGFLFGLTITMFNPEMHLMRYAYKIALIPEEDNP